LDNYKTIKELADDLNVSKQAVWQKIKRNKSTDLRKFMATKGNTVYVDVDGQKIIKSMFSSSLKEKNINLSDKKIDDDVNVDVNIDLNEEVHFLRKLVDKLQTEKSELHKIVDQQQQLTLQSNKQIDQLQQQVLLLSKPAESDLEEDVKEEKEEFGDLKNVETEEMKIESEKSKIEKKWFQFWK